MRVKAFRRGRLVAAIALALVASGCATGARTGAMTVPVTPDTIISESSPLRNGIKVGSVTGGSETNPLWKSNVSDANFRQALEQSLSLQTMLASAAPPRFTLNAELLDLDQPLVAINTTVTAKIRYKAIGASDSDVRLDETLTTPYTANLSDAFVGMERLRIANEGAIRENIKAIIAKLIAASAPGQPLNR
jgi:hypothetical protein